MWQQYYLYTLIFQSKKKNLFQCQLFSGLRGGFPWSAENSRSPFYATFEHATLKKRCKSACKVLWLDNTAFTVAFLLYLKKHRPDNFQNNPLLLGCTLIILLKFFFWDVIGGFPWSQRTPQPFWYALYGQCFFEKWSSLMPLHSGTLHTQDLPCCIFEEESAQKTFLFVVCSNLIPECMVVGRRCN